MSKKTPLDNFNDSEDSSTQSSRERSRENRPPTHPDKGQNVHIGFVGFQRSGKTMTLITLDKALHGSEWRIRPNSKTNEFLREQREKLYSTGQFPDATRDVTNLAFHISRKGDSLGWNPGVYRWQMHIREAHGGELSSDSTEEIRRLVAYLARCAGIIFLIDSESLWQPSSSAQNVAITDTMTQLRGSYRARIPYIFNEIVNLREEHASNIELPTSKTYISFCLTKVDEISNASKGEIQATARERIGAETMRDLEYILDENFFEYNWFATSAIGTECRVPQHPTTKARYVQNPDMIRPHGARKAFEWIFENIRKDINKRNRRFLFF